MNVCKHSVPNQHFLLFFSAFIFFQFNSVVYLILFILFQFPSLCVTFKSDRCLGKLSKKVKKISVKIESQRKFFIKNRRYFEEL